MRMNVQVCPKCRKPILEGYRMVLMSGPKGYRRYAVCARCAGNPAGVTGGRQRKLQRRKAEGRGQRDRCAKGSEAGV